MPLSPDELKEIGGMADALLHGRRALTSLLGELATKRRFADMFEAIDVFAASGSHHRLAVHRFYMDRVGAIVLDALATMGAGPGHSVSYSHHCRDSDRPLVHARGARQFEEAVLDVERDLRARAGQLAADV